MPSAIFTTVPTWIIQPSLIHNILENQFVPLKNVSSSTSLKDNTSFISGLRQALFWRRRLAPSTSQFTVIFSFLGPQGLLSPDVNDICQALKGLCNLLHISEIYRPANSHFLGFTFTTAADASTFRQSFLYYANRLVIHVPLSSPFTHRFRLSWLPPAFPDHRIHHFLNKHTVKHTFQRDLITIDSNIVTATNSVTGTLEISPSQDINLIPHLIPLPPPHIGHALLIISGRPSFCLRCGQVGHVRRTCPAPRCTTCHYFHVASVSCPSSDPVFFSNPLDSYDFADFTTIDASPSLPQDTTSSQISLTPPHTTPPPTSTFTSQVPPTTISSFDTANLAASQKCDHTFSVLSGASSSSFALSSDFSPNPLLVITTPSDSTSITTSHNQHVKSAHDIDHTFIPSPIAPALSSPSDLTPAIVASASTIDNATNMSVSGPSRSSSKPTSVRKRAKSFSPDPSISSPTSPKSVHLTPDPSWAEQVELDPIQLMDTSAISTANSSFTESTSDASHYLQPPTLLYLAASKVSSSDIQPPPSSFGSSSILPGSFCDILCPHCNDYIYTDWLPDCIVPCPTCDFKAVISYHKKFIPNPKAPFAFLSLATSDVTDPIFIEYLLLCLRLKIPLLPFICHSVA